MSRNTLFVEFDYDFALISIVSSFKDHRICWQINNALNIDLERRPDLEISNSKKRDLHYFTLYAFEDELNFLQYYLIGNKSDGAYLLPELKRVDYLLMMKGDAAGLMKYDVIHTLKYMNGVVTFFESEPAKLKSKQNLIFE